ncbi:MAG: BlaI/MecI/CopY family transcriptional regulator [Pirellulales bacterium]
MCLRSGRDTISPNNPPPALSEAQMEIMHEVWTRGEATVTEVWQAITTKREVARNTILTLMERLEQRGWLTKRQVANANLYKAAVSQKRTLGRVVKDFVDQTFQGDAAPLIVSMLENSKLSKGELDAIAELIEEKKKRL